MIRLIIALLLIATPVMGQTYTEVAPGDLPALGTPTEVTDSFLTYDSSAALGSRLTQLVFSGVATELLTGAGTWVSFAGYMETTDIDSLSELNTIVADATLLDDGAIGASNAIGLSTGDTLLNISGNATDDTINEYLSAIDTAVGALAGGHDAATLDANAETLLSLSTQEFGLDTQGANEVFAGPTTGVDAVPAFRALVADDIPDISATYGDIQSDGSVAFSGAPIPNGANTVALGSAAAEWSDIFFGDGAIIYGQNDQSATLTSSASLWTANNFAVTTQFKLPSSNVDPTSTAGYLRHDSTVTNFTGGALRYYNGSAIKQVIDMTAATAESCTTGQTVSYNATSDVWECSSAGSGDFLADGSVAMTGAPVPNAANTIAIGSAAAEWADLYLGDGAIIYGQNNQTNTLTSSSTGWGANLVFTGNAGIDVKNGATSSGVLKLYEDSDNGNDYIYLRSSEDVATNKCVRIGTSIADDENINICMGANNNTVTVSSETAATALNLNAWTVSANGVTPDAADGAALGSTALEWSDAYFADSAVIYGQADQSNTLTSSATGWTANLDFTAPTFTSSVATGTAPFTVASTTAVANLNASAVEGTDLGTLTDTYLCTYDSAGTEIDCATDPAGFAASTSDITAVGDCASGACTADAILDDESVSPTGGTWDLTALTLSLPAINGELGLDVEGVEFAETDTLTDCSTFAATGGGIFYDDSEGVFKKCQDNVLTVLDTDTVDDNDLETDGATGIADTEIFIGTGAGTGNYATISGDAALANTGALTVADDVLLVDNMADDDWGDFSIATNSATLDADVVGVDEMADADHGQVAWSGGVASVQGLKKRHVTKTAAYTIGTDDADECYGGTIYVTTAATITACDNLASGMNFDVITIGAIAVSVDPQDDDLIVLDGTALTNGQAATNTSTTGDLIHCEYYSADGWYCASGSPDGDHWAGP